MTRGKQLPPRLYAVYHLINCHEPLWSECFIVKLAQVHAFMGFFYSLRIFSGLLSGMYICESLFCQN